MSKSSISKLSKAVELIGGQEKTAIKLGLKTQSQISSWINGRRPLPAHHCTKIEALTNGKITRYQLRPDVFGKAPPTTKAA